MSSQNERNVSGTKRPDTENENPDAIDATALKALTPDELRIVEIVAQSRGLKYAIDNLQLILAQAREIGEL